MTLEGDVPPCARTTQAPRRGHSGGSPMLDLLYIVIGAAFVGVCVLYTYACDQL
jgi:hypothetical protein